MQILQAVGQYLFTAGQYVLTTAAGANAKELTFAGTAGVVGLVATQYLGGWDQALQVLVALLIADYVTGVLGAVKQRKLDSEVMFWGGVRKAIVLAVIGLAAMVDSWVSVDAPVFRTMAIYFYAAREGLSVFENIGVLGVPLPGKLKDFFTQLSEKGEAAKPSPEMVESLKARDIGEGEGK